MSKIFSKDEVASHKTKDDLWYVDNSLILETRRLTSVLGLWSMKMCTTLQNSNMSIRAARKVSSYVYILCDVRALTPSTV